MRGLDALEKVRSILSRLYVFENSVETGWYFFKLVYLEESSCRDFFDWDKEEGLFRFSVDGVEDVLKVNRWGHVA